MKMRLISEPAPNTRTVFIGRTAPLVRGYGLYRFRCGACDAPLVTQSSLRELGNAVFKCPECGSYNEVSKVSASPKLAACASRMPSIP